jgi:peptide/nickel transport system permease protein
VRLTGGPIRRLIVARLLFGVFMLWVVSIVVFFFTQALPGDVVHQILGHNATPQSVTDLRARLGLDRSLTAQYWSWLSHLVRGDPGRSLANPSLTVGSLIRGPIGNSAVLVALTAVVAFPLAFAMGTTAARHRGGHIDALLSSAVLVLLALPEFVIAVLVVAVLATSVFRLFPAVSTLDPSRPVWDQLRLLILPVLSLVLGALPYLTQMVRATMLDVLESEYVAWARLNGVPERRIVWRHALKNAAAPSVQVATIILTYLASGIVVVETVFSYPGIGLALVHAVDARDIPVIQAITMLLAGVTVILYLVSDVVVVLLTPKLRTRL